jgi:hypothetical protein
VSDERSEPVDELPGMPAPLELRLETIGDNVVVLHGGRAVAMYERSDRAMRNLAIVSMTGARVPGVEVAAAFGIRPEHVSRLRRQVAENGAAGLLPPTGRPSKLDARARARAFAMSDQGASGTQIARTLRVSEATISRLLARRPAAPPPRLPVNDPEATRDTTQPAAPEPTVATAEEASVREATAPGVTAPDTEAGAPDTDDVDLPGVTVTAAEASVPEATAPEVTATADEPGAPEVSAPDTAEQAGVPEVSAPDTAEQAGVPEVSAPDTAEQAGVPEVSAPDAVTVPWRTVEGRVEETGGAAGPAGDEGEGGARIEEGSGRSVYAGAMLLHPFLETVGAGEVLGAIDSGPGRRYDSTAVALESVFCFALGCSSIEGSKHLQRADAGLLVGVESFPHLRTLRPRLAALADAADPVRVQSAFAKAMLAADSSPPCVFFVDGHFVSYTGAQPVAKGWNTRRRHAEPGRDDNMIVDDRWRAICFQTGPPVGLATGMLDPVDQLLEICGPRRLMIGFDRGGSYPKAFSELRDRGVDWVTYRRAPLATPTATARRSWVTVDGRRRYIQVADEKVDLDGYGTCRQLTIYEHGKIALQILTSDMTTPAARLAYTLRCRWRIENMFKYVEQHYGQHWLCDYRMDLAPDTSMLRNPARTQALATLRAHEQTAADLEKQIGKHHTNPVPADVNPAEALCMLEADLYTARAEARKAKAVLKQIPANVPANEIDPDATRATPRINRRAMQTVLRLLAYNAELDLARALNAYLQDPDEYRALTRHLLRQPGHIHYTPTLITVTLDPPPAPRVARALALLIEQINQTPPRLAGDRRKIRYELAAAA